MSDWETNDPRKATTTSTISRLLQRRVFDVAYVVFTLFLAMYYAIYISTMAAPIWDGAVYLENAQNWLTGDPLYEPFRPPLISWIIAGIWAVSRVEDWTIIRYLQAAFTMGAGIMLYLTLRKHKGGPFAFGVASLTMLNTQVFYNSALILTEGISLFFLTLTLYFMKSENITRMRFAGIGSGISLAFTFAARYPIVLQGIAIIAVEALIRRNHRLLENAIVGAVPVLSVIVLLVLLKTATFAVALEGDTNFTVLLSPFYVINSIAIWGYAVLLVPLAFLFKRTFEDKYNYTFIAWFIVSLLFWSASTNHQERFGIQFSPAVYFLALLAIENIVKSKLIFQVSTMRKWKSS
jgi:hypothetical protein